MPTPTTIEITKRLKQKVIRFVKKNKSITNRQCRELLSLGPDQVVHVFNKMVEDGELVREGKTVSTRYRL
jgi:predicted HTH transcriptional regulator